MDSHDAAIASALEDLQLQHVLLQSLDEEQPDAFDEREDILEEISRLERRISTLRKDRFKLQKRSSPSANKGSLARAQLDGSSFSSPSSHISSSPGSKRPADQQLQGPSKRSASSTSRHPADSSRNDESQDDFSDGDDLLELIGVDGTDTLRELQDEQRRAEQWLNDRKEQEKKDAEFALMLQEGLYEPPHPASVASASPPGTSSPPRPASSPDDRLDSAQSARLPGPANPATRPNSLTGVYAARTPALPQPRDPSSNAVGGQQAGLIDVRAASYGQTRAPPPPQARNLSSSALGSKQPLALPPRDPVGNYASIAPKSDLLSTFEPKAELSSAFKPKADPSSAMSVKTDTLTGASFSPQKNPHSFATDVPPGTASGLQKPGSFTYPNPASRAIGSRHLPWDDPLTPFMPGGEFDDIYQKYVFFFAHRVHSLLIHSLLTIGLQCL